MLLLPSREAQQCQPPLTVRVGHCEQIQRIRHSAEIVRVLVHHATGELDQLRREPLGTLVQRALRFSDQHGHIDVSPDELFGV